MSETAIPADAEFVTPVAGRRDVRRGLGRAVHRHKAVSRVLAEKPGADLEFTPLYRGYARYAVLRLPLN